MAVVTGAEAYISAAWYATKAKHGRVVPTWNHCAVHFTGRARVHTDRDWLLDAITRLTNLNEQRRDLPWSVHDAPDTYIEKQVRAIVGIEFAIENVEGKAKPSQNRLRNVAEECDSLEKAGVLKVQHVANRFYYLLDRSAELRDWVGETIASRSRPMPSLLAREAGTVPVKKIHACAPTPERDTSSAAGTPLARAALRYAKASSIAAGPSKSAASQWHESSRSSG